MKIQHMDVQGSSLLDAVLPEASPFTVVQEAFGQMPSKVPGDGPLRSIFVHYGQDAEAFGELAMTLQQKVLAMTGQVWHDFEVLFSSWPFQLLAMVDERHGKNKYDVASAFWYDHPCNKDQDFSVKFMSLFQSLPLPLMRLTLWSFDRLPSSKSGNDCLTRTGSAELPSNRLG